MRKRHVDLVIISDIHLGTYGAHAKELNNYLRSIRPNTLILNGDIIDIWQFRKNYWPPEHMETIHLLLDFVRNNVNVIMLTGNHDDLLRKFSGFYTQNLQLADKLVLQLNQGERAWIFHGDVFDLSIQYGRWLAKLAGRSYDWLIMLNRLINNMLAKIGKGKISLAQKIKFSMKRAIKFIQDFETMAAEHAIDQGYDYVICGHIHYPQIKTFHNKNGSVTYLNSGDWVENLTSLEYDQGQWRLYSYYNDNTGYLNEEKQEGEEVQELIAQDVKQIYTML